MCRCSHASSRWPRAVSELEVVIVGLAIATGIVGVVVPVLPGSLLVWAAIAVWALAVGSATAGGGLAGGGRVVGRVGGPGGRDAVDRRRPALEAARPRTAPARRRRPPSVDPRRPGARRR